MTKPTIIQLPQTDQTALFIQVSGTINRDDYMQYFDAPVRAICRDNGWYNLYIDHLPDFNGWAEDAAALSFKCISECGPHARRLAYVNPPDSRRLMMKLLDPIINAELKFFEDGEQDKAIEWIKSYRP